MKPIPKVGDVDAKGRTFLGWGVLFTPPGHTERVRAKRVTREPVFNKMPLFVGDYNEALRRALDFYAISNPRPCKVWSKPRQSPVDVEEIKRQTRRECAAALQDAHGVILYRILSDDGGMLVRRWQRGEP